MILSFLFLKVVFTASAILKIVSKVVISNRPFPVSRNRIYYPFNLDVNSYDYCCETSS
jgi:hypothetical protein